MIDLICLADIVNSLRLMTIVSLSESRCPFLNLLELSAVMISDIKSLSWRQTIGGLLVCTGAVCPGFLTLFLFKPELVTSLETIKILLFSISLSLPVVFVNLPVAIYVSEDEDDKYHPILISLLLSSKVFYPSLLISYLLDYQFKLFLMTIAIVQLLVASTVIINEKFRRK